MSIVEVKGLKKQFADKKVIDDISFTVEENRVFGFLGRNGSGKTTTMKMLLGLLQPDEGSLNICGELVRFGETKTNKYVGFLPDVPMFYPFMTAREYLLLCGEITGLKQPYTKQKSERSFSAILGENLQMLFVFMFFLPSSDAVSISRNKSKRKRI